MGIATQIHAPTPPEAQVGTPYLPIVKGMLAVGSELSGFWVKVLESGVLKVCP